MDHNNATFLADIPTTFAIAAVITLLFRLTKRKTVLTTAERVQFDRIVDRTVIAATLAFIVFVEMATYFNVSYAVWMMRQWPISETAMTGTEFMWHGYFRWPFPALCRTVLIESDVPGSFCSALEPTKDPLDMAWWPVAVLCFYVQYLAALLGRNIVMKSRR